ncbi:tRNA pseudouridine(55) synthase TruB [Hominiventricola filiformis]|uniref:tRNA pseudouridine synthase B n=1 Tax=Hominiventricola filiformis TaxID=2885352 RepID=A0AAE3A3V5_9FIRM|nr:tRNA pseudouridine(55) synthase TruB [Hominiventricola filiformis]MCC2125552.1 tRNA pseudouridine(55) synthase TruB [Hominiventricola filiformis]
MINGVINIYKERGFTSHDVVAKLRGILKQKKIGHTGTLDPDAEGVLPVCLGKGTRLCDMLTDHSKVYEAVLLLGQSTDTQDVSGNVLQEAPVDVSEEEVREAIMSFVGPYDQIPPMYSALKVNGQKLCDLARAGKEVERKARPVEIYEIQIEEIHLPRVRMNVFCSKGTYIRTLCHDIGEKLKCHGCMESLLRTRVGQFLLKDSLTLAQVETYRDENRITEIVMPVDQVFSDCPALKLTKEAAKLGYNGNPFTSTQALTENDQMVEKSSDISLDGGKWFRVYDPEGVFIGVYAYDSKRDQFRPEKMFYEK